jgi:hypothetical protein
MTPTWTDYLNAVEAAALDVQTSLIEGRAPQMPELELPQGPPPPTEGPRRERVAALVTEVTTLLSQHRDAVVERLASLPTPRGRRRGHDMALAGQALDVMG